MIYQQLAPNWAQNNECSVEQLGSLAYALGMKNTSIPIQSIMRQVAEAQDLGDQVLRQTTLFDMSAYEKLLAMINNHIKPATFMMKTRTVIGGGLDDHIFELVCQADFGLDMSTFLKTRRVTQEKQALLSALLHADQDTNTEVDEMVLETMSVNGFGLSTRIEVDVVEGIQPPVALPKSASDLQWWVELIDQGEVVAFDFSMLFSYLLGFEISIDPHEFSRQVTTSRVLFERKEPFEQLYHWTQDGLIVDMTAVFEPVS